MNGDRSDADDQVHIVSKILFRVRAIPAFRLRIEKQVILLATNILRAGGTKLVSASSTKLEAFLPQQCLTNRRAVLQCVGIRASVPFWERWFVMASKRTLSGPTLTTGAIARHGTDGPETKSRFGGPSQPAFGPNG